MIHFIVITTLDSLKNSKAAVMTKFLIGVQGNAGSYAFVTIGSVKKVFENSHLNCDPQSDDDFSFFPGIDRFGIAWSKWIATDQINADTGRTSPHVE